MNTPKNQGWRSGSAPKGPKQKKSRNWRQDKAAAGTGTIRWGKILKVGSGILGIVALVVTLLMLWFTSDKYETSVATLGPTGYQQVDLALTSPPAPQLIKDWTTLESSAIQEFVALESDGTEFDVDLNSSNKVSIFFLNAIAKPDGSEIVLFDGSSQPDQLTRGTSLAQIIAAIQQAKGSKLALIDLSRVRTDWRLGVLVSDFLTQLQEANASAKKKRTVILTSSHIGERSWSSQRFNGGTAFAHFVAQAMQGKADSDQDQAVSVRELVEYVQDQTTTWVARNRETAPGQHPQSIPAIDDIKGNLDFILARVSGKPKPPKVNESPGTDPKQELISKWTEFEKLGPIWRQAPLESTAFIHQLHCATEYLSLGRSAEFKEAISAASGSLDALSKHRGLDGYLETNEFFQANMANRRTAAADLKATYTIAMPEQVVSRNLAWFNDQRKDGERTNTLDEVATAIEMQTLAEQSVAASIGAIAFIRDSLEAADQQRRREHDQLFSSTGSSGELKATSDYQHVLQSAGSVTRARTALQDATYSLPSLAEFAAGESTDPAACTELMTYSRDDSNRDLFFPTADFYQSDPSRTCARTNEIEANFGSENIHAQIAALFTETRALRHQFAGKWNVDGMEVMGQRVQSRLAAVQETLVTQAEQIALQPNANPTHISRRQIVRLLKLPFLPAATRSSLLSLRLRYEQEMSADPDPAQEVETADQHEQQMLARGQWQAFWMLQVLSLSEDGSQGTGNAPLPEVEGKTRWKESVGDWLALDDGKNTYKRLVELGTFAHQHFGRLRKQLTDDVNRGLNTTNLQQRRRLLARADHLARFLHPFDAAQVKTDPARLLTELDVAELALYYGHRTWQDFWRIPDSDPGEPDWYGEVVNACLDISERLDTTSSAEHKDLQQLAANKTIRFKNHNAVEFSQLDRSKPLVLALGDTTAPTGQGSVWLLPGKQAPTVRVRTNGLPLNIATGGQVTFNLDSPGDETDCNSGSLTAELFFRGHRHELAVQVDPCSAPSSILTSIPAPPTGSIKVAGKAERSIVFVLDWSLSMKENNRWQTALDKLIAVINRLDDKDEVGLVLFGHRIRYLPTGSTTNTEAKAFSRASNDVPRTYKSDHQTLAGLRNKADAMKVTAKEVPETLLDWLQKLQSDPKYGPYGNTPMFRAIDRAYDLVKADGGAVVVITDGAADDSPSDIKARLRASNVTATVILFGFNDPKAQQTIRDSGMDTLRAANNPAQLAKAINDAIPARDFAAKWPAHNDQPPTFSRDTLLGQSLDGLTPSTYEVQSGRNTIMKGVRIRGGEQHLFKIVNGDLKRVRQGTALGPAIATSQVKGDPSLMAHSKFEIDGTHAEITMVLDHEDDSRPINWPAEIRFQLSPVGGDPVSHMQVRTVPGQSVPTWLLSTDEWPVTGPNAVVTAHWKMQSTPADRTIPWTNLKDGGKDTIKGAPGGLPNITVVGGGRAPNVTITLRAQGPVAKGVQPLRGIRVQLGEITGKFRARSLPVVRKLWPDGQTAEFTFTLPGQVPDNLSVGITSEKSLRNGSVTIAPENTRPRRATATK